MPAWTRSHPNIRWLIASRILRSLNQGFISVVFPLYVAALGYSTAAFGTLLALVALGGAAITLALGIVGDRYGRRRASLAVGCVSVVGLAMLTSAHGLAALVLAATLSTFARGGGTASGTSWGPVYPVVQPLLASSCRDEQRNTVFAGLAVIGAIAAAGGSALAAVPAWLHAANWSWVAAYRLMLWAAAAIGVVWIAVLVPVREQARPAAPVWPSRRALSVLGRLSVANLTNGLALGMLGPLLTYWFYVRFGVGPAELGVLYTIVNALSVAPYLGAARFARRLGAVSTIAISQALAAVLLFAQALCTTFTASAALYVLSALAQLTGMPIRQSFTMGVTEERHRSVVSAVGGLPLMIGSSVSPDVGTTLMESWTIEAPLVLGAGLTLLNAGIYFALFHRERLPEEARHAATQVAAGAGAGSPDGG